MAYAKNFFLLKKMATMGQVGKKLAPKGFPLQLIKGPFCVDCSGDYVMAEDAKETVSFQCMNASQHLIP